MNYEASRKTPKAFEDEGVRYLAFGGAAVNLHGLPRFTEDRPKDRLDADGLRAKYGFEGD